MLLQRIIQFSVKNKLIIGLFTLMLILAGVYHVTRLPIDALPDITSNQVQVITVSPSLAASEVEQLITFPIEQVNASIPGLTEMRSVSRFGLSVITLVFNDDVDVYWARQQVSERLIQVRDQIPSHAGSPELAPVTTGLGEIYQYVVRPAKGYEGKYDLAELRSIQDWIIRRQLLGTPGVADVSSFGGILKQYEVAVQPSKLKSVGITVGDVFNALQKNNENSGASYIEKGPNALFIRTEGLASNTEQLGNIFVKQNTDGTPVFIKDVAEVRIGNAVRYGAMTYKAQGEVSGAVVLMLKGSNASAVVKELRKKMDEIRKTLPEGVVVETFLERTKMVDNAIGTVSKNLVEGALIVVFVLVFFLGNFRAGLIVASVIPLSMLFAVIMMNLFGVSGNLMSLGALDFGLIVDGAVIIVEALVHRLSHVLRKNRIGQAEMDVEVTDAASRMMSPAVFGQVIILIVYLPILTLVGIEGKMFRPMAQTVSFALMGAFILSLTYVPMISSLFLSKKLGHNESWADKMMNWLQRFYGPLLKQSLRKPAIVLIATLLLFCGAIFALTRLGGEFIPELEEGDFAVDARLLPGASLTKTIEVTQQAVGLLQTRYPEVEKIVTRIGASEIPTDPMPIEMTDIIISLKPKKSWVSAKSFDELATKMSKTLNEIPGLSAGFQYPVQMRFNELLSGARQDVVCKLFGENLDTLTAYAAKIGKVIQSVNGAADIYIESVTGLPQIVIKYHREAIALHQLNIADVNQVLRSAFAGEVAGTMFENERRYDLVVRMKESSRQNISDIQQLLINTPGGLQVPLAQLADIQIKDGPNQIQREDARRRIIAAFNVRGRDVQSVVTELESKLNRQIKLPAGYSIKYGGQFENLSKAKDRLFIAVPAALLLILLMLYFAFGSMKYGILIFSAIPLSAIGGIFALVFRDMPFSISAGIGFIALFGVAVLNGIVLITEFNRLKKDGIINIKEIVMEGTKLRLRPVLMTASVASLGFLPMALSQGAGAEVQRPLATVVIGGLITATILTLIVLPVLYAWLEKRSSKKDPPSVLTACILCLVFPGALNAQQDRYQGTAPGYYTQKRNESIDTSVVRMPLSVMLDMARKNNLSIAAVRKNIDYSRQLENSSFDPPKALLGGEYGNMNSTFNDSRFFISQDIGLPVIYKRQKIFLRAETGLQEQLMAVNLNDLDKKVKTSYYEMSVLLERKKLINELDSIFKDFARAAEIRFKAGETNTLETTTALSMVEQLMLQADELEEDLSIYQVQLKTLLNSKVDILPAYEDIKMAAVLVADSVTVTGNPLLGYYETQVGVTRAQTLLERNRLVPDFTLGYSNLSIRGYQSKDGVNQEFYDAGNRFSFYQLSVGLPLFTKSAKSRIKAMHSKEESMKLQLAAGSVQLQNQLTAVMHEQEKSLKRLNFYESRGLMQAALIMKNAMLSFRNGDIAYVEWTVLMNNAVNLRLGYLEAVKAFNNSVIEIQYLTAK
jgi:cobalt-zinc-cadmium resistance protein CzcA